MTKDRLLAALEELIEVEEGVLTLYANFSKALVRETEAIGGEKKKEILKMLSHLYRDSTRHKELVDEMTREVEASATDEY